MGEKGVGKLSQETPPPREGEPMGVYNIVKTDASLHKQVLDLDSHASIAL